MKLKQLKKLHTGLAKFQDIRPDGAVNTVLGLVAEHIKQVELLAQPHIDRAVIESVTGEAPPHSALGYFKCPACRTPVPFYHMNRKGEPGQNMLYHSELLTHCDRTFRVDMNLGMEVKK